MTITRYDDLLPNLGNRINDIDNQKECSCCAYVTEEQFQKILDSVVKMPEFEVL